MNNKKIESYGILKQNKATNIAEKSQEEIFIKGFTILEDVLSDAEVLIAQQKLLDIYEFQVNQVGVDVIESIKDQDIVRAPLAYDHFFMNTILFNEKVLEIISLIFDNNFILREQNGIINRPDSPNFQLQWHRDIMFQHYTSSKPLAISCLFCLDDFNISTGGTYFLPSTHKVEFFPSDGFIKENEYCPSVSKGSVIIFDSMIFHRGGFNFSNNFRRAINNVFVIPIIKQSISLPKMLMDSQHVDTVLSTSQKKILGFDLETDDSVVNWRKRRFYR